MSKSKSKSKTKSTEPIVFISCDGKEFKVDKVVAMKSEVTKMIYGDGENFEYPHEVMEVPGHILSIVIDYCKKLVAGTSEEDLKAEFFKLKPRTLGGLINAANYLRIRSLLDLSAQVIVELLQDASSIDTFKWLDIKEDFTYKEAEDVHISEAWAFKKRLSPEFAHLKFEEQRKIDRELFLERVLPVLSSRRFGSLEPEDKREWVIAAVLMAHVRRYIADAEYPLCPTCDEESELVDLELSKLVEQDGSETLEFDITDLFVEDCSMDLKASMDSKMNLNSKGKKKNTKKNKT